MILTTNQLRGYGHAGRDYGRMRRAKPRRGMPSYRGFGSFGWDNNAQAKFCSQSYGPSGDTYNKCMDNSFPNSLSPPWTDLGKSTRGLPDPLGNLTKDVSGLIGGTSGSSPSTSKSGGGGGGGGGGNGSPSILGMPKKIALIGGGVLGLGVVAFVIRKLRKGRR